MNGTLTGNFVTGIFVGLGLAGIALGVLRLFGII
jgi:hypothetical protein